MDSLAVGEYAASITGNVIKARESNANPPIDSDTTVTQYGGPSPIPTIMPYSATNLSAAILLLGNLLGTLDARSRKHIGALLGDLAETPDDAEDIATKSAALATAQKKMTKNKDLDRALKNNKRGVESAPAPLEPK